MKTETLKLIVNAFNTASRDETRLNLCGVLLEKKDNGINIVGCDGHKLSVVNQIDDSLLELIGDNKYFINRDDLKIIKLAIKAFGKLSDIPAKLVGETIVIGMESLSSFIVSLKTCKAQGITYPDYNQVIPRNESSYSSRISFNPEYLIEAYKAIKATDARLDQVFLEINPGDKMAALIIKTSNKQGMAVLMPMRG